MHLALQFGDAHQFGVVAAEAHTEALLLTSGGDRQVHHHFVVDPVDHPVGQRDRRFAVRTAESIDHEIADPEGAQIRLGVAGLGVWLRASIHG